MAETIPERIKLAMEKRGISTQIELARVAGVSETSVGNWMSGRNEPRGAARMALCNALGIRVEWLMTGQEPMELEMVSVLPHSDSEFEMVPMVELPGNFLEILLLMDAVQAEHDAVVTLAKKKILYGVLAHIERAAPNSISRELMTDLIRLAQG